MSGSTGGGRYTPLSHNSISRSSSSENLAFFDATTSEPLDGRGDVASHRETSEYSIIDSRIPQDSNSRAVEGSSSHMGSAGITHIGHDTNMHSGAGPAASSADLELQAPTAGGRLSAVERLKNVATFLFPFKQTYERLHNGLSTGRLQSNAPGRFVGQGTDGVFRNLMAKPDTESSRVGQEQHPPTYEEAAADSSPEYWEATMISPMYDDEVFVSGLPVGNLANFVWNVLVTVAFQLVGFVLCYLLHTSHAAKQGTRAGLGITIIMYGYSAIPTNFGQADRLPVRYEPTDPNSIDISKSSPFKTGATIDTYSSGMVAQGADANAKGSALSTPLVAYAIIALGILVFLKSFVDFYYVKREEKRILAPQASQETHSATEAVDNLPVA